MLKKLLIILFTSVALMNCEVPVHEEYNLYGDSTDDGSVTPSSSTVFKMDVNGTTFVATTAQGQSLGDIIQIAGFNLSSGKSAQIVFKNVLGNQLLDDNSDVFFGNTLLYVANTSTLESYSCPDNWEYNDAVGTINITSLNTTTKKVSGTFSGKAYNDNGQSVIITNGIFTNVTYQ